MVHLKCRFVRALACGLALLFTSNVEAKTSFVTKGMTMEDALAVVKRCVVEATSFNAYRTTDKHKQLRAEDTLENVGVSDSARLNALRRYLVRNTQLGVQSVWGRRGLHYRPYVVSVSAMDGLKASMTLQEVAGIVLKEAGLPFLTYGKTAQIVGNCRVFAKNSNLPTLISTKIHDDLSAAERPIFRGCLLGSDQGIESVGLVDGEGDYRIYKSDFVKDWVDLDLPNPGSTYASLVTDLYENATVRFGTASTAEIILLAGILEEIGCDSTSFQVTELCGWNTSAKPVFADVTIQEIQGPGGRTITGTIPAIPGEAQLLATSQSAYAPRVRAIPRSPSQKLGDLAKQIQKKLEGK
jgi:hypothetical protein